MNASQLWAELFTAAHPSTGDILLTRAELAARLGLEPRTISELMTELAGINAITRRKERAPGDLRDEPQCRYAHRRTRSPQGRKGRCRPAPDADGGQNLTDIALPRQGEGRFAAALAAFGD